MTNNSIEQEQALRLYHKTWDALVDYGFGITSRSWRQWRHRFDKQIKTVDQATECCRQMVDALGDPFSRFLNPKAALEQAAETRIGIVGVGIDMLWQRDTDGTLLVDARGQALLQRDQAGHPIVRRVIAGSAAQLAGISGNDRLVAVDNQPTGPLEAEQIAALVAGYANTSVELTWQRDNEQFSCRCVRQSLNVTGRIIDEEIGYIRILSLDEPSTVRQVMNILATMRQAQALIIDLRGNPGGRTRNALEMASLFLRQGLIVRTQTRIPGCPRRPHYRQEEIRLTDRELQTLSRESVSGKQRGVAEEKRTPRVPYLGKDRPVAILVDADTASAAEMFTAALQDNAAATVIGAETFGKRVGQIQVRLPLEADLVITTCRYERPSGHHHSGRIVPDIIVESAAVLDTDSQLAAALELLQNQLSQEIA